MRILRWTRVVVRTLDSRDGYVYAGLGLATLGGLQLSVPWTLIIVGGTLLAMGLFVPRPKGD